MKDYDLIIIGSGGGLKLRAAANLGKRVAVIEREDMGGTCLNRGCIPSKMLIHVAEEVEKMKELSKYFVHLENSEFNFDWEKLIEETTAKVIQDSQKIEQACKSGPVDLYQGHARFVSDRVVEVNGEKLTGDVIVIATGSRPHIPTIPGLKDTPFMTSREALRNFDQPKKMLVIGGGYIAVELGYFYGMMGTDVEFLVRSGMLKYEDKDVRSIFEQKFCSKFPVHFGITPTRVEYKHDQFFVYGEDKLSLDTSVTGVEKVFVADSLFVATGVVPNADDLGLDNTGIQRKNGYIQVDERMQTDVDGVYAIGDVVGNYLFRHSVNFEGEWLLEHLFLGDKDDDKKKLKYPPMPHAVFSSPQIAGVGKTEDELRTEGWIELGEGKSKTEEEDKEPDGKEKKEEKIFLKAVHEYKKTGMGMAMKDDSGMVKLLIDKKTRKVLGAHIVGEKASDMIHLLIGAMTWDRTVDDLLAMIYIHPALSEVIKGALKKIEYQLAVNG